MLIINTLLPVVLLLSLGLVLRKTKFLEDSAWRSCNRLTYWIGLPCLLFAKTAVPSAGGAEAMRISGVIIAGCCACIALGYVWSVIGRVPQRSRGALLQAAGRGNLVYIGLPVILYALGANGADRQQNGALAVLAIAPVIPFYNVASVLVLLAGQHGGEETKGARIRKTFASIGTNPLILSCLLGMAYSRTGLPLPLVVGRSCTTLGQMALPLALLGLGAGLRFDRIRGSLTNTFVASLIKVAGAPLAGLAVAKWFGVSGDALRIALIFLTCPTAVASYVVADQLGGDSELTASIVVVTTLLCLPALAVILALL